MRNVPIRQLVADFATYLYLPRLAGPEVLVQAMHDGIALLTWQTDTFTFAESYDEGAARYRGLAHGPHVALSADSAGLLVKPDVAQRQIDAEVSPVSTDPGAGTVARPDPGKGLGPGPGVVITPPPSPPKPRLRRYHGTVTLDPARVGRDASRIADEVIAHFAGQVGAAVTVTLEIEATLPDGATDQLVRTVTENSRTLKFASHGFEAD